MFTLRFPEADLAKWSTAYSYTENDGPLRTEIRPAVLERGWLKKAEFLSICKWKTQRSKSRCASNSEFTIRTVTRAALATSDEALKIDLLRTLVGVEWPTASALLHFTDPRPYPILDYRALWSLGFAKPPHYCTEFWLQYLAYTRELAESQGLSIRTIDRALWQYSKAKQRPVRQTR